jgi:hypothetical protein
VRVIDDRKRLFGVINVIDFVVLAAVLVGLAVAASLLFGPRTQEASAELSKVEYTLVVPMVPDFDPDSIDSGDTVSKLGSTPIGKVVSVSSSPSPIQKAIDAGEPVALYSGTGVQDVEITVEADAQVSAQGFVVGQVMLRNNTALAIATPRFEGPRAIVTSMKVVD